MDLKASEPKYESMIIFYLGGESHIVNFIIKMKYKPIV